MKLEPNIQRYASEIEHTYLFPCLRYAAASIDWRMEKLVGGGKVRAIMHISSGSDPVGSWIRLRFAAFRISCPLAPGGGKHWSIAEDTLATILVIEKHKPGFVNIVRAFS